VVISERGRTGLIRRVGAGFAVAVTSAVLLTGCAAGQHAATVQQIPAVDGVTANSGTLGVRVAGVAAPTGSYYLSGKDASLQLILVNDGRTDDKLVSVTSDAAKAVLLSPSGARVSESSASASPTGSTTSASPAPLPSSEPITVAAGSTVQVGYTAAGASIVLTGLTKDLYPSQTIPITFSFSSGAQLTTNISVKLTEGEKSVPTLPVAPSEG
jgi:copper(I)-binding protein